MRPQIFALILSAVVSLSATAQNKTNYFLVTFKDKNNSKYSINKPLEFLSARALERRQKFGIRVDQTDLPVNEKYVKTITAKGYKAVYTTRWLNGVIISTSENNADKLKELSIVSSVQNLGGYNLGSSPKPVDAESTTLDVSTGLELQHTVYGSGYTQVKMLGVDKLHDRGFRGKGVHVAVFDAGFKNVNRLSVFSSMFSDNRFLGSYDLVDNDNWVFSEDNHGTQVLSCMAADQTEVMTGTAPEASYFLFRTENAAVELPAEEAFWLIAAERADSMGIDIVNSSLGYTRFDNSELGHSIDDLTGFTAISAKAANMAWSKGMILVNSAGNEGDGSWRYVGSPADAIGSIAVAAVTDLKNRAYFSSYGKEGIARLKPDVAAMGEQAIVCHPGGYIGTSNGTSFASPIMCGAIASLLGANPKTAPAVLRHVIYESSTQFNEPDFNLGYGIPDFEQAYMMLHPELIKDQYIFNWPEDSVVNLNFKLRTMNPDAAVWEVKYFDESDQMLMVTNFSKGQGRGYSAVLSPDLYYGESYRVEIYNGDALVYTKKFSIYDMNKVEEFDEIIEKR